jgi:hypothetical protein
MIVNPGSGASNAGSGWWYSFTRRRESATKTINLAIGLPLFGVLRGFA